MWKCHFFIVMNYIKQRSEMMDFVFKISNFIITEGIYIYIYYELDPFVVCNSALKNYIKNTSPNYKKLAWCGKCK